MSLTIERVYGKVIDHIDTYIEQQIVYTDSPKIVRPHDDIEQVEAELDLFCRISKEAYLKNQAEKVEEELSAAAKKTAEVLCGCIRTNELLGYLDTKDIDSATLYRELNDHFGLDYSDRNFRKYRK